MKHISLPTFPPSIPLPFTKNNPWLAPLAGYSDLPFRLLCRSYGASCCTTEMVSAKGLLYQSPGTFPLLATTAEDSPLIVQLFGAEPSLLAEAVHLLKEAGQQYFDLNVGCSVAKVMRQGCGAAMLKNRDNLLRCAEKMLVYAGHGNVGFKLRLGLDDTQSIFPDLPKALEELGAGWITLHPRTAKQGFSGKAHWEEIRKLVALVHIPVVASGDLMSAELGLQCLEQTGAATVMYARGSLHHPRIFSDHKTLLEHSSVPPRTESSVGLVLKHYLHLVSSIFPNEDKTRRLRGILAAFVRELPCAKQIRVALCKAQTHADLQEILRHFFP